MIVWETIFKTSRLVEDLIMDLKNKHQGAFTP